MRIWTMIANGPVDDGGFSEPYTAAYDVERYCEKHPDAEESDIERIAANYHCHVRWRNQV